MKIIVLISLSFFPLFMPSQQRWTSAATPMGQFRPALPGYHYSFPKDHGAHEAYRTEWWYYTGHLQTVDNQTYGYQLTFFRSGMDAPHLRTNPSRWAIRDLYLAHFAITDENKKQFFYTEKVSRAGIGNAGAETTRFHVWNGGWMARAVPSSPEPAEEMTHHLVASEKGQTSGSASDWPGRGGVGGPFSLLPHGPPQINDLAIDLILTPMKPPVIHGKDGISKKGAGPTQASYYYSITRMETRGTLKRNGRTLEVKGTSWMDHEFGSSQLSDEQAGWDWFGLQLDNGTELMFYHIRLKDGRLDPFSSGTISFPDRRSEHLRLGDFYIKARGRWQSPKSGANYPSSWQITIPDQHITLTVMPTVPDQELITGKSTGVTYWEGSVNVMGSQGDMAVTGKGYVELTGYAEAMRKTF